MSKPKRTLQNAGFDEYADSVRTAQYLDSIRQARFNDYKNIIVQERRDEVNRNKQDAKKYGPFAIFPIMYRGAKDIFSGPSYNRERAIKEAVNAEAEYNKFIKGKNKK